MNIFVLHQSPIICARYHCDKHVVKMVTETAQILSTVHRLVDGKPGKIKNYHSRGGLHHYDFVLPEEVGKEPIIPLLTHHSHPAVKWAMDASDNYTWLAALYLALSREYSYRYQRSHGGARWMTQLQELPSFFQSDEMTPWPLCMPDEYKRDDVVESYRAYYIGAKLGFAKWTKRPTPHWINQPSETSSSLDTTTETGQGSGSQQPTLF